MSSVFNLFRLVADALHAASKMLLIRKLRTTRNAAGISLKTQLMYFFVFTTRYLDLLWVWRGPFSGLLVYNTLYKLFYLASTTYTIYLVAFRLGVSYNAALDRLPIYFLLAPCAVLGLLYGALSHGRKVLDAFWAFSLFLEAVAMLPQLFIMQEVRVVESITTDYVACLGVYRAFYLLNWAYRAVKGAAISKVLWLSAIIQTLMYSDFLFEWIRGRIAGKRGVLPTSGRAEARRK